MLNEGYLGFLTEHFNLVADGVWKYAEPPLKVNNIVFSDCGSALLGGYSSSGLSAHGLVYIMRKCEQWYKFMMLGFQINVKVLIYLMSCIQCKYVILIFAYLNL